MRRRDRKEMREGTKNPKYTMQLWKTWSLSLEFMIVIYFSFALLILNDLFSVLSVITLLIHQISFWIIFLILKNKSSRTNKPYNRTVLIALPIIIVISVGILAIIGFLYWLGKELTG